MARHSTVEHLARLLALPAWIRHHDGATLEQAAEHFGVTAARIRADLSILWVSGDPSAGPQDYLDFDASLLEEGQLSLLNDAGLGHAFSLTADEGAALAFALEPLLTLSVLDADLRARLQRIAAILRSMTPGAMREKDEEGEKSEKKEKQEDGTYRWRQACHDEVCARAPIVQAVQKRRRLHLEYVSATDEVTSREVDPIALRTDGRWLYLDAWCLQAKGRRSFRYDRILHATVLDVAATTHRRPRTAAAHGHDDPSGPPVLRLSVAPSGQWLLEDLPASHSIDDTSGGTRIDVQGRDWEWLIRLILSASRHLEGVEPTWAAREAAHRARQALELYEQPRQGTAPPSPTC